MNPAISYRDTCAIASCGGLGRREILHNDGKERGVFIDEPRQEARMINRDYGRRRAKLSGN